MNQILFGLGLALFSLIAAHSGDGYAMAVDILPDFAGYLILWLMLEKRRFNRPMKGLYVASAIMVPVTFLVFLAQVQNLLFGNQLQDPRNTGLKLLNMVLSGVSYIYTEYYGIVMLAAVVLTGWLIFAMLEYWGRTNQHKLQCTVCRIGLGIGAVTGLCYLASTMIILPFSWNWITYPMSLLMLVCAWFAMRNVSEIETPSHAE